MWSENMLKYEQITNIPQEYIDSKIEEFLAEDDASNDITTQLTIPNTMQATAFVEAQSDVVFCGADVIKAIFKGCDVVLHKKDGDLLRNGDNIATIEGNAANILSRERVMLNVIQRLSGIATATKKYVDTINNPNIKILDTRKTTPGLRLFEKYAIQVGGGNNHRYNLASAILIKDNHVSAAGGIENVVKNVIQQNVRNLPVELEVDTLEQLKAGLALGIKGFLLDNMSPERCSECVDLIRKVPDGEDIFVEASGGITLENLAGYRDTGINAISIGALTHRIVSADIHLVFEE